MFFVKILKCNLGLNLCPVAMQFINKMYSTHRIFQFKEAVDRCMSAHMQTNGHIHSQMHKRVNLFFYKLVVHDDNNKDTVRERELIFDRFCDDWFMDCE